MEGEGERETVSLPGWGGGGGRGGGGRETDRQTASTETHLAVVKHLESSKCEQGREGDDTASGDRRNTMDSCAILSSTA